MRIGVDIGGTKTDAVAIGFDGSILHQARLPTGFGPLAVLDSAATAVRELAEHAGISPRDFESIGIGIPGRVDSNTGRVAHAVNLGLDGLDLGGELGRRLDALVKVENDVNAAALGAFHLLGTPSTHSMAYLNLGTGLAGGLVLDGKLWRGSRGAAGEIGHIPVDPDGQLCPCGQRGCLELVASGSAVARQWPSDHPRPVQALFDAADAGDARAIEVRARLVENIASAVRVLVLTVDVDIVVIGGGMSSLGEPLSTALHEVLESWASVSPFVDSLDLATRVRLLPADFPAAAVGAALVGAADRDPGAPAVNGTDQAARAGSDVVPSAVA